MGSDWKRALNSSSVPRSASRNLIWSWRRSRQSAPGWPQSWPKGKLDWKCCAQKQDRRPPLNHQRPWMLGRRLSKGTFPVEGFTSRWFAGGGHDDPKGCGDTRGQSFRAHGSHDRRGRKQASSCGGCIEFCLSRRPGLRGFRIGEAAHPGPPRLRILLDSVSQWSQVPIC